jgi:hypothetical protein
MNRIGRRTAYAMLVILVLAIIVQTVNELASRGVERPRSLPE